MGAIESSVRGLAVDLKPLRINAIELGLVKTELYDKTPPELRDSIFNSYEEKVLVGHVGTPEEVAEAYIFAMKVSGKTIVKPQLSFWAVESAPT
ncbi:hypothetical protein FS749_009804 [Ceratobasidium sp. UAMH 11750]|nr:hypothetical protein FS749_009804 [Ceratobasidium sp. UAMH 11750]